LKLNKLRSGEVCYLRCSENTIMIKGSRRLQWAGYAARIKGGKCIQNLIWKLYGIRLRGRRL